MLEIESLDPELAKRQREAEMIYGTEADVDVSLEDTWKSFQEEAEYYTVTKLTGGIHDPNRVNVFLDGHFAFSLDVTQVVEFGLKVQQKVTPEQLIDLRKASEFGKLYQRTMEWALGRPHSVREARDYLRRRQYKRKMLNRQREKDEKRPLPEIEDEVAKLVIDRLVEKKYLNDEKFAKYYIENRNLRKGISQKRLRLELRSKGVAQGIIDAALEESPRDEEEEIAKMIAKKRRKYNDFQLAGYLVRQGFSMQQAKDAIEKAKQQDDYFG